MRILFLPDADVYNVFAIKYNLNQVLDIAVICTRTSIIGI